MAGGFFVWVLVVFSFGRVFLTFSFKVQPFKYCGMFFVVTVRSLS